MSDKGSSYGVALHVWGEYACFTRPEMKVERVSYDVATPAAARGILESILWKPAIEWRVRRIDVLKPIRWGSVRRNELGSVGSWVLAKQAMNRGTLAAGIVVDDDRQQRAALVLRDVAYVIRADFRLTERAGPDDNEGKFLDMFRRRVEKGKCHRRPYLGTREFAAHFGPPPPVPAEYEAINADRDLGWMFYDFDYSTTPPGDRFFRASLRSGHVDVPEPQDPEVKS
jgi:CRISPR-associated protein Cas5d